MYKYLLFLTFTYIPEVLTLSSLFFSSLPLFLFLQSYHLIHTPHTRKKRKKEKKRKNESEQSRADLNRETPSLAF